ncbi:MAG: UbiA prenyltransferase family [Actinomycetota bacterium]|nr:UbiA prenyltransferase family [Actinomycetota bacterium]
MTTWAPVVRRHRRLQAVGLFVRLSALGTTLAVVLLGAASVSPALPWATAAVLVIVAVGFHVYFFVSNDVIDLPVDRLEPRRAVSPLVRGTISRGAALAIALGAVPVTLAVAGAGPGGARAWWALIVCFALMTVYNLLNKRTSVPWLLDLVQGVGWAAFFLYGAATRGSWTPLTWWSAAFWVGFMVLANGVHGALRDVANDARCGARTTAIAMGARADADGRVVLPRGVVAYAWALHVGLVAVVLGAWAFGDLGYGAVARGGTLVAVLGLGAAGAWALSAAATSGGDPESLRLAGTLHLLLLMAMPVVLLLPWLATGFRLVVVVGFLAPLAALGWLPDMVRWVRRCR